jgi:hypothetical protein
MIWAAIASELDLAAWKLERLIRQRLDPKRSPHTAQFVAVVQPLQQQLRGLMASGARNAPEKENAMSAFMINTNVMTKVVTTILQNSNRLSTIQTCAHPNPSR